jgi:replication factor A2
MQMDDSHGGSGDDGLAPMQYVRVWGRLKSFNNKKNVGAHVIRPVDDFNEVNYHLLEATYVHLYFTKGAVPGANGAGGDGMFVDGAAYSAAGNTGAGGGDKLPGATALGRKMYNFLMNAPGGNEGVHLNVIANGTGMSIRDVQAASDELLGFGVIYATVDEETWAVLEY